MSYQSFHAKSVSRLNYQTLRSHSLAVAHTSRFIMKDVFGVDIAAYQESAFFTGLLHDAGKALPSDYGDYRERLISGWRVVNNLYFVGVGPEGEEIPPITDGWTSCPRGQGHIPRKGY